MPESINQEELRRLLDSRWPSDAPWDQEHDTNASFSIQRLVKQFLRTCSIDIRSGGIGTVSQCTARNKAPTIP